MCRIHKICLIEKSEKTRELGLRVNPNILNLRKAAELCTYRGFYYQFDLGENS